jgi:hypothetical protein
MLTIAGTVRAKGGVNATALLLAVMMSLIPWKAEAQAPALSDCEASGATDHKNSHLIVINLVDPQLKWRVASFSKGRRLKTPQEPDRCLSALIAVLKTASERNEGTQGALNEVDRFSKLSAPRFYSDKGETVELFVFYAEGKPDAIPQLSYKETARQSRLETDLATLAELILSGTLPLKKADATVAVYHKSYKLEESRGTVSLTAAPPAMKDAPAPPTGLDAIAASIRAVAQSLAKADTQPKKTDVGAEGGSSSVSATVLTGSAEHWFIGVNVNVRKFSEVTLDKESSALVPKEKSPAFLLSANYFFGDLASSGSDNIYIGVAFEPTRRPDTGVGPIVGVRLRTLKILGLSLDSFSPYVGVLRVVNDEAPSLEDRITWRTITGLSFNLDKVSGWLKK